MSCSLPLRPFSMRRVPRVPDRRTPGRLRASPLQHRCPCLRHRWRGQQERRARGRRCTGGASRCRRRVQRGSRRKDTPRTVRVGRAMGMSTKLSRASPPSSPLSLPYPPSPFRPPLPAQCIHNRKEAVRADWTKWQPSDGEGGWGDSEASQSFSLPASPAIPLSERMRRLFERILDDASAAGLPPSPPLSPSATAALAFDATSGSDRSRPVPLPPPATTTNTAVATAAGALPLGAGFSDSACSPPPVLPPRRRAHGRTYALNERPPWQLPLSPRGYRPCDADLSGTSLGHSAAGRLAGRKQSPAAAAAVALHTSSWVPPHRGTSWHRNAAPWRHALSLSPTPAGAFSKQRARAGVINTSTSYEAERRRTGGTSFLMSTHSWAYPRPVWDTANGPSYGGATRAHSAPRPAAVGASSFFSPPSPPPELSPRYGQDGPAWVGALASFAAPPPPRPAASPRLRVAPVTAPVPDLRRAGGSPQQQPRPHGGWRRVAQAGQQQAVSAPSASCVF